MSENTSRSRTGAAVAAAVVVALLLFPQIVRNPYFIRVFINSFYLIALTISLRIVIMTGQMSFAHYAFMGIGAYTSALLVTRLHWNYWVTVPLAGGMGALVGLILGYITLRIKGAYFAIATFAMSEVIRMVWVEGKDFFGGMNGIMGIPSPNPILGLKFGSMPSYYYYSLILALLTFAVMYRLDKSRFGLTFRAIALADNLAESVGINIMNYKVLAFAIGCFFAGLVGAFYSSLQHYISPTDFTNVESILLIVFLVVGGRVNIYGSLVGVGVLTWLPVLLDQIPGYKPTVEPLIYGGFLLVVMLFIPEGILGIPARIRSARERRRQTGPELPVPSGSGEG